MAACDGSLSFRDDVLRCELSAGHDGPCKAGSLSFRRVQSAQAAYATALATESQTTTRKGSGRAPNDPLVEPGECHCSACGQPCGTCSCPRVYRTTANQRRSDAARRDTPQRVEAFRAMRQRLRDTGICIDCGHDSADPKRKDGRCLACGKKAARVTWTARQCRRILNDSDFACSHGSEDPRDCKRCRKCVSAWVKIHEVDLRARVRLTWPGATAAALNARDQWRRDHEAAAD